MTRSPPPAVGGAESRRPADEASPERTNAGRARPGAARPDKVHGRPANGKVPDRAATARARTAPVTSAGSPGTPDAGRGQGADHAESRPRGRDPATLGGVRGSGDRTASRIRFLHVELTNPHQMTPAEITRFILLCLVLYVLLISSAGIVLIVVFDHLVAALATHAGELRQLNPAEVETTIYCVAAFTSIALAAKTINRLWPRPEPIERTEPLLDLGLHEELDLSAQEE